MALQKDFHRRGYQARTNECRKAGGYDIGDVVGEMAGESSLGSLVATMVKGARPVLFGGTGCDALPLGCAELVVGGVVDSLSSSGIVGQYVLRTCFSAGRRMGLERKKSMPESRHSCDSVSENVIVAEKNCIPSRCSLQHMLLEPRWVMRNQTVESAALTATRQGLAFAHP